jgi:hypothetical protein
VQEFKLFYGRTYCKKTVCLFSSSKETLYVSKIYLTIRGVIMKLTRWWAVIILVMLSFSVLAEEIPVEEVKEVAEDEVPVEEDPPEEEVIELEVEIPVEEDPPEEEIVEEVVEEVIELPVEEEVVEEKVVEEPVEEEGNLLTGGITVPVEEEEVAAPVEEENFFDTVLDFISDTISAIQGDIVEIQALLRYDNASPISGQPVDFSVNDNTIATEETNEEGLATLMWDTSPFAPGAHIVGVDFGGNDELSESSVTQEFTIEAAEEEEIVVEEIVEPVVEEEVVLPLVPAVAEPVVNEEVDAQAIDAGPVQEVKQCRDEIYETWEKTWGICTKDVLVCDDEPANESCRTVEESFDCITGRERVQKIAQDCDVTGILIDNGQQRIQLSTQEYGCTTFEDDNRITVICDSTTDGNGDGICSSGESCQKFVVEGRSIRKMEKNSREDFVEGEDDSYFVGRVDAEVLE